MSNWSEDRDRLIAALYSATLSPNHYDEVMDTIDTYVFNNQKNAPFNSSEPLQLQNGRNDPVIDPDLLMHFRRAYDIQVQAGRKKREKSKVQILLDAAPNPAFIFDTSENIIALNGLAEKYSLKKCSKLVDYCDNKYILANIRKFIKNGDGQKLLAEPGYLNAEQNTNTCILVRKVEESFDLASPEQHKIQAEKLYFFTIIDIGFDKSKTDLFKKAYDLTKAEVDIAVQLASGKQLPEIANERGASVATIRTQFKSIKKKTSSRDIPSVVRLLCGFSAGILILSQMSDSPKEESSDETNLKSRNQITLRDGRKMAYLEQGNPNGIPVILLHTMPYGQGLLKDTIEAANRMGLRFFSPFRPGYGASEMPKNIHNDRLLDVTAADIYELLDHFTIDKADIIGVGIGAVCALRFASLYPNRVSNLFTISRPPIWRDEWLSNMPKRQRLMLRLAKYTPQLLPLMLRATMAYVDKGHAQDLFRTVCADSVADTKALKNPETCELLEREFVEGLQQGAKAVQNDCHLVIKDFSDEARRLKHKFHILHGDDDKVFDISQSRAFIDMIPGTELEIIKDAGHLLLYTHWEYVLRAIKKKHA